MKVAYLDNLQQMPEVVLQLGEEIESHFDENWEEFDDVGIRGQPHHYQLIESIENKINFISALPLLGEMLDVPGLISQESRLRTDIDPLKNPHTQASQEELLEIFEYLREVGEQIQDDVDEKVSRLDEQEIDRINEAIHDLRENCFFSAVAMCAVPLERRLERAMVQELQSPPGDWEREEWEEKIKKKTLGGKIGEYSDNRERYNSFVPQEFEGLLTFLNGYRIPSVHDTGREMNRGDARSCLTQTLRFLTDSDLQY